MNIAVSSSGKDFDSLIDPRFGRCACFLMVETDDMGFEVYNNQSIASGEDVGILSVQFISSKSAKAVSNRQLLAKYSANHLLKPALKRFLETQGS